MNLDWRLLSPELILTLFAVVCLLVSVGARPHLTRAPEAATVAIVGSALALAAVLWIAFGEPLPDRPVGYALAVDGLALFFKALCILATLVVVAMSCGYDQPIANRGELYALLLFAEVAMCLLCSANDAITLYLSLEFLSLVSYALAGLTKQEPRSNEAAVKYFLFGAVSAGVMLYGLSLLYGLTGTTDLAGIASGLRATASAVALPALVMVLAGLLFKVSGVPFHMWTPDVYQGAPLPVAAFLSVASKAAGFAVLCRVVMVAVPSTVHRWPELLAFVAAATMVVGNLSALKQTDIVRMLAFSTVAQAGYVLMGVAALTAGEPPALAACMMYLLAYLVMNLGAFAAVIAAARVVGTTEIADYRGLAYRAPWLAWTMVFFLLSLTGLPPTAGFIGKYFLFQAAIRADLVWLAVVAFLNSVVAAYYYFNVMRMMVFLQTEKTGSVPQSGMLRLAIFASLAGTLVMGVAPSLLIDPAERSSRNVLHQRRAGLQVSRPDTSAPRR
jgi:proton-translocating NADH-quinone oxidoreductase chain N